MRIAIFADIHGKILLPFKMAALYQQVTGKKIDLILQCGDMGAFPDLQNLDKATIRHAKYDRDELGFHDDFCIKNPEIAAFLEKLNLEMICVRGNHEDHAFLDELEAKHPNAARFPIDIYEKVFLCKTGKLQTFETETQKLTFMGIGRIGDRKGRYEPEFIQEYEQQALRKFIKHHAEIDILLTHDKDDVSERGYGMAEISKVLENIFIAYHFHGHTGEPFQQRLGHNGLTYTVKIKELEFNDTGALGHGCMVILAKNQADKWQLEVVDKEIVAQVTKFNWKYL
ncbi:MAG: metallophosphoesterase [Bacteroidia bacterium]